MTNLVHSKVGAAGNQQLDPNDPFNDQPSFSVAAAIRAAYQGVPTLGASSVIDMRGDSFMVGFGLSSTGKSPAAQLAQSLSGAPYTNNGINSVGMVGMLSYIWGDVVPLVNNDSRLGFFSNGVNDMREGNTALRLEAYRGVFGCMVGMLASKLSAWRQFYNGDAATYYGAPAGSMVRSGFANISAYGTVNKWRGVYSETQNDTITFNVNATNAIYIMHQRYKGTGSGGTAEVTIDGAVVDNFNCDGTGLAVYASAQDETTAAAQGYPTLRRIGCAPGNKTVVIRVSSASGAANRVGIEACAGDADMVGPTLVVSEVAKLNAAGYLASPAAYASLALGLQASNEYSRIARTVMEMFYSDGLRVAFAPLPSYNPTLFPTQIQGDGLHPADTGAVAIAGDMYKGLTLDTLRQKVYSGQPMGTIAVGASPFVWKNTGPGTLEALVTGGTVSGVAFARENSAFITYGTASPTSYTLSPGDSIQITHAGAPTLTLIPR